MSADYRPKPLTETERLLIIGAINTGSNLALAARQIGRSERWLRYIQQHYPDVKADILEAKEVADGMVQAKMFASAMNGNVVAMIFWMKNRQKWADRQVVVGGLDVHHVFGDIVEGSFAPELEAKARAELEAQGIKRLPPPRVIDAKKAAG